MLCMNLCLCLIVHFINVLNTERAKRARKKNYVVPFKLPDRFVLSAALFLIAKDTIVMYCHIKKQDYVHPQKRLSLEHT